MYVILNYNQVHLLVLRALLFIYVEKPLAQLALNCFQIFDFFINVPSFLHFFTTHVLQVLLIGCIVTCETCRKRPDSSIRKVKKCV